MVPPPVVMAHYSYRGHWHAIHSQPLASHRSRVAWHGSVELACSGWGYDCLQWCGIHSRDHGPVMAARIGRPAGCRLYQSAPPRVRACWQRSARIYLWTRLSSTSSVWLCSQIPLRRSGYRVMGLASSTTTCPQPRWSACERTGAAQRASFAWSASAGSSCESWPPWPRGCSPPIVLQSPL